MRASSAAPGTWVKVTTPEASAFAGAATTELVATVALPL